MRWVTYRSAADGRERAGLLTDDAGATSGTRDTTTIRGLDTALVDLLSGDGGLTAAAEAARSAPAEIQSLAATTLLAPIPRPPSIRDFLSFEEHLNNALGVLGRSEIPEVWYQQPVFYFSNPAAVRGPNAQIPISPGSERFDYEVEVAAVVGRGGTDLTPAQAEAHIAGYTILCDWSARDLQAREAPAGLGPAKSKDGATSLGPYLVTPDELEPYRAGRGFRLRMQARVNGRVYGGGSWADIHWSFGQMLAYAARGTELRPGDVIGSGTVGTGCLLELVHLHGEQANPWLRAGDEVSVEIEQLGAVTGQIVTGPPVVPLD